ncbi:MAG: hypothetical protein A2Y06_02025 [Omnitrophica WOR_2 bacterium GWA2_37_7]|nr:MAG: hypothetical protein A2Y06_02025 [Omnitrophica WOR_2 bacterium GWA2_37_7]
MQQLSAYGVEDIKVDVVHPETAEVRHFTRVVSGYEVLSHDRPQDSLVWKLQQRSELFDAITGVLLQPGVGEV